MTVFAAVERGDMIQLKFILERTPAAVHSRDERGDQPLHYAAIGGRKKAAALLLDLGADLNARGDLGKTPIRLAIENHAKGVRDLLIARGANLELCDNNGLTPLYFSAAVGDKENVKKLLSAGARKDIRCSIYIDGPDSVLAQLVANPDLLRLVPNPGDLLLDAVGSEHPGLVQFLLNRGISADAPNWADMTPLREALRRQQNQIVTMLLTAGADVHLKDSSAIPILKYCEYVKCNDAAIKMLKQSGAKE
jgi:uncharacterized protein